MAGCASRAFESAEFYLVFFMYNFEANQFFEPCELDHVTASEAPLFAVFSFTEPGSMTTWLVCTNVIGPMKTNLNLKELRRLMRQ